VKIHAFGTECLIDCAGLKVRGHQN